MAAPMNTEEEELLVPNQMNLEPHFIKQNLRKNASAYSIFIVDSEREPGYLVHLLAFIKSKLANEIPDCNFASVLLEDGIQPGLYFILVNAASEIIGYAWTAPDADNPNARYVYHLCANTQKYKGGGTVLMNTILDYTKQEGFGAITLDALLTAVPFYESLGFVKEKPDCSVEHDGLCRMTFQIVRRSSSSSGGKRSSRSSRKRCKKRVKTKKRYPKHFTKPQ